MPTEFFTYSQGSVPSPSQAMRLAAFLPREARSSLLTQLALSRQSYPLRGKSPLFCLFFPKGRIETSDFEHFLVFEGPRFSMEKAP